MKEDHTAVPITQEINLLAQPNATPELTKDMWQMLQIFSVYRCLLTSAFFILNAMNAGTVGQEQPLVYIYVLLIYFLLSIVYVVNSFLKNQNFYSQVDLQLFTDIIALTLILHTSGGLPSGLNILYLPVVAAASVLAPGKISFLYAAIATIAVLSEQLYAYLQFSFKNNNNFTLAGLTGIALFATTLAVNMIYQRLTMSQKLGKEYKATIEKFEQIIATILQEMPTGVLVTDRANHIAMMNQTAKKILGATANIPPILAEFLQNLYANTNSNLAPQELNFNYNGINIQAQFILISNDHNSNVIVMLEDLSQQEQQAQNMKLISLGRLTASIAHEIRNPLNAISHAAQLLSESKSLQPDETRLLDIIKNNSVRTNKIIESVLLLSKSKPIAQQNINLIPWTQKFITQFIAHGHQEAKINLVCDLKKLDVLFDPTHLQQIITNLCENGIRYSLQANNEPAVTIKLSINNKSPCLDVIDQGHGIDPNNEKYLFEPFFTTENTGTGLGLFVAKELSRANGAKLEYYKAATIGSCFRIIFPNTNN